MSLASTEFELLLKPSRTNPIRRKKEPYSGSLFTVTNHIIVAKLGVLL